MVLNANKDLKRTTKSIAVQFSLLDTQVHDICLYLNIYLLMKYVLI